MVRCVNFPFASSLSTLSSQLDYSKGLLSLQLALVSWAGLETLPQTGTFPTSGSLASPERSAPWHFSPCPLLVSITTTPSACCSLRAQCGHGPCVLSRCLTSCLPEKRGTVISISLDSLSPSLLPMSRPIFPSLFLLNGRRMIVGASSPTCALKLDLSHPLKGISNQ